MILMISRGRGYVPAEQNKGPGTTIGVIPVDSNFSPGAARALRGQPGPRRPAHGLRQARSWRSRPTAASTRAARSSEAAETLIGRLAIFADPESTKLLGEPAVEEVARRRRHARHHDRGARAGRALATTASSASGVETIGDLISKTEAELSAIPNFGKKSIEEVKENLAAHGLGLRSDEE